GHRSPLRPRECGPGGRRQGLGAGADGGGDRARAPVRRRGAVGALGNPERRRERPAARRSPPLLRPRRVAREPALPRHHRPERDGRHRPRALPPGVSRLVAAVVVALVVPAAAGAQPGVGVRAKTGKGLYAAKCLSCHGVDGSGVTSDTQPRGVLDLRGLGPPLKGVGALAADFYLTTGYMPLQNPHDQPRHTKSPFDKREIAALVAYVATFGKGPGVPHPQPERGEVSRGLSLFTEHCAGCHQIVAEGGYVTNAVAPPLHQATPVQIAEAVRLGPYLMPRFPTS